MTDSEFENFYREHLEEDLIFCLASKKNISYEKAMGLYYKSNLANMIYRAEYGIQYLDYHILADYVDKEISATLP